MNILYCGDASMADGMLLSILSLLKTAPPPLHVFILTAKIPGFSPLAQTTADFLQKVVQAANKQNTVQRLDITAEFNAQKPLANMDTRFSPYCMLRLYSDLLPLPKRLLYLDTDVVAVKDCTIWYEQDLAEASVVGVLDHYGKWAFHHQWRPFDYLNSGVLLMNLPQIKASGLFARCRALCQTKKMFMPDQSALNLLAKTKKIAPRRFNDQHGPHQDTVLLHFSTRLHFFPKFYPETVKPWDVATVQQNTQLNFLTDLLAQFVSLQTAMKG